MLRKISNTLLVTVMLVITAVFLFRYGRQKETFYGDALGYYLYLPAAFIYHNTTHACDVPESTDVGWQVRWSLNDMKQHKTPQGTYLDQYTYGTALMELPFFLAAHQYERSQSKPANGFSNIYNIAIKAGTLLYAIAGLALIYFVLRRYFTSTQSLAAVTLVFTCTNLFWFSVFQAGMAHVPLFFLYAALIALTLRLYERQRIAQYILTGLLAGIITLIRPTDILCLLIPLLYGVYNRVTLSDRIAILKQNGVKIAAGAFAFLLPIIPQLLYWKAVTGSYICYSYGDQSFNWSDPQIIKGLFGFSNGWLPYSPIMIFAIMGLLCYKAIRQWAWSIYIILPAYIYIIYSWYCWYYLNGLGSRPMIHLYPLLAIPLAAFIQLIVRRGVVAKAAFSLVCIFLLSVNLCFSVQELYGVIDSAESNMAFNRQMLYRTKLERADLVVKDIGELQPDSSGLTKIRTLSCSDYEDSLSAHYVHDPTGQSKYAYHMTDTNYIEVAVIKYDKKLFGDARWFRCSGRFMYTSADYYKHVLVLDINDKKKLWRGLNIENKIFAPGDTSAITFGRTAPNVWGNVFYYARIPNNLQEGDVVKLIMWVTDKRDIYMDDLCLELYR